MKILTLFFGVFLFLGVQNPKEEIIGTWEFPGPMYLNEIETIDLAFWMKFTEDSVIISNSNSDDKRFGYKKGGWSSFVGSWTLIKDTISIQFYRKENINIHTGTRIKTFLNKQQRNFRFQIKDLKAKNLELKLLDRFIYFNLFPIQPTNMLRTKLKSIDEKGTKYRYRRIDNKGRIFGNPLVLNKTKEFYFGMKGENLKDNILGAWEFSRPAEGKSYDRNLNEIENPELAFWMKFTKDSVIFSNSNDERIWKKWGHVSYFVGTWDLNKDTIAIQLYRSGSTNCGIENKVILDHKRNKYNFRFLINQTETDQLELSLLDRFIYSKSKPTDKNGRIKYRYGGTVNEGIEIDELLKFKRVKKFYHWLSINGQI